MQGIDIASPDLMYPIHNAQSGGVFHIVSDERPGMADALTEHAARTQIPVHVGDIDSDLQGARRVTNGVFKMPPTIHRRDSSGRLVGSGMHYAARRHNTFSVIIEVPMWPDRRSADTAPCGQSHVDVLNEAANMLEQVSPRIGTILDPVITQADRNSRFGSSLTRLCGISALLARKFREQAAEAGEYPATVAERYATRNVVHMLRGRTCGTALRVLDEKTRHNGPEVEDASTDLEHLLDVWVNAEEAESPTSRVVSPGRLAEIQIGAILTTAIQHKRDRGVA